VKSRFLRFLDLDNRVLVGKNVQRKHMAMPTKDDFNPDHTSFFLADEPEQQGIGKAWDKAVISPRVLKAGILVATAAAIGTAVLSVGNPATLFADVTASLADKSALQPGTDQSTPGIQSTADAQALPPAKDAPIRDEIAAASEPASQTEASQSQTQASQSQTENSGPSSEALFRQFQAWAAEKDAQAQVEPVQPAQDAPAQAVQTAAPELVEHARAPLRHRHVRPVHNERADTRHNARAETRSVQNSRKKLRREQEVRAQVPPARDARTQEQPVQNAQGPSFLQTFGWRN